MKLSESLHSAFLRAEEQLGLMRSEWEIDKYPNFLKSCQMHKSSWEVLRLRFMERIISNAVLESKKPFVISFMGSSVTAGHDSLFSQSYPVVAEGLMKEVFAAANIELVVRNHALGNNPCMPYDVCVGAIAGYDADIVHWEQSYNCFGEPMYAKFVHYLFLN
jgi:hypothetical protein